MPVLLGCGTATVSFSTDATSAAVPSATLAPTTAYLHFGDSITCGNYASTPAKSYTGLMDATVAGPNANRCRQGGLAIDVAPILYASTLPAIGQATTLMVGTNDTWVCGGGARCLDNYTKTVLAGAAWVAIPSSSKILPTSMQQSGTWVEDPAISGIGLATNTAGSSLTFNLHQYEAGRHLYLAWKAMDGNEAGATVTIDGETAAPIAVAGLSPITTPQQTTEAPFASAYPLGGVGDHTIMIRYAGSGTDRFTFLWAGAWAGGNMPRLILGGPPKQFERFDTITQAYTDAAEGVASLLADDGFYVQFADSHDALGPDDFYDVLHPNDAGYAHLAAAFLNPSTPPR